MDGLVGLQDEEVQYWFKDKPLKYDTLVLVSSTLHFSVHVFINTIN